MLLNRRLHTMPHGTGYIATAQYAVTTVTALRMGRHNTQKGRTYVNRLQITISVIVNQPKSKKI